jgi:hypothetical protein
MQPVHINFAITALFRPVWYGHYCRQAINVEQVNGISAGSKMLFTTVYESGKFIVLFSDKNGLYYSHVVGTVASFFCGDASNAS